jgi:hypothetical protein
VRPRRGAATDGRRNAAGDDRLARTLNERRLFARYRERDDQAARDALVERARRPARHGRHAGVEKTRR